MSLGPFFSSSVYALLYYSLPRPIRNTDEDRFTLQTVFEVSSCIVQHYVSVTIKQDHEVETRTAACMPGSIGILATQAMERPPFLLLVLAGLLQLILGFLV